MYSEEQVGVCRQGKRGEREQNEDEIAEGRNYSRDKGKKKC